MNSDSYSVREISSIDMAFLTWLNRDIMSIGGILVHFYVAVTMHHSNHRRFFTSLIRANDCLTYSSQIVILCQLFVFCDVLDYQHKGLSEASYLYLCVKLVFLFHCFYVSLCRAVGIWLWNIVWYAAWMMALIFCCGTEHAHLSQVIFLKSLFSASAVQIRLSQAETILPYWAQLNTCSSSSILWGPIAPTSFLLYSKSSILEGSKRAHCIEVVNYNSVIISGISNSFAKCRGPIAIIFAEVNKP